MTTKSKKPKEAITLESIGLTWTANKSARTLNLINDPTVKFRGRDGHFTNKTLLRIIDIVDFDHVEQSKLDARIETALRKVNAAALVEYLHDSKITTSQFWTALQAAVANAKGTGTGRPLSTPPQTLAAIINDLSLRHVPEAERVKDDLPNLAAKVKTLQAWLGDMDIVSKALEILGKSQEWDKDEYKEDGKTNPNYGRMTMRFKDGNRPSIEYNLID